MRVSTPTGPVATLATAKGGGVIALAPGRHGNLLDIGTGSSTQGIFVKNAAAATAGLAMFHRNIRVGGTRY